MLVLYFVVISAIAAAKFGVDATPASLDGDSLKNLDKFVRQELLFKIIHTLNETTIQQNIQSKSCELKVNTSFSKCTTCFNNICKQGSQSSATDHFNFNDLLNTLVPTIFKTQLLTGSKLDIIGAGLPSVIDILGTGGKAFIDKLGGLAKELGHTFSDGTSALRGLSLDFLNLGNSLISKAGNIVLGLEHGAGNLLSSVGLTGAGGLLSKVEHGSEELLHGVQTVGKTLSNVGQAVGNGLKNAGQTVVNTVSNLFNSIFGKRSDSLSVKRCTSACPVCDTLNIKVHTKEEILTAVCGQSYMKDQANTMKFLNSLRHIYNTTLSGAILSKVDYDPASILTGDGVSFTNSHFSFVVNGDPEKLQSKVNLKISDLTTTAKGIADQIWKFLLN